MQYGWDDPLYQEDPSWLQGQNTPTDPQAQVEAAPNPWLPATPAAATPPSTPTPQTALTPSYTQDLGQTGADSAAGGVNPPAATTQPVSLTAYQGLVQAVNSAPDAQARTVAHDTLARQVQSDLEADGHAVSWKGDQLVVDGRTYELGASSTAPTSGPVDTRPLAGAGAPLQATAPPADYNSPPLAADVQKTITDYIASQGLQANQGDPSALLNLVGYLRTQGINAQVDYADANGHTGGILVDGHPYQLIDGSNRWTTPQPWQDSSGAPGASAIGVSPFANGTGEIPDWLKNPASDPDLMALSQSIPGFEDIYNRLMATDPQEQQTADLVSQLLQHPESLDDRTVEELKAKNAEEIAAAARAQDEDLQHFGFSNGLDMSPWLAGQRADTAWSARNAIVGNNRSVDISSADTNLKDRQAAASIGQGWAEYKKGKSTAAINSAVEGAAAKGNLEQAAKTLGMTKAQLTISYIGQNLNYSISLEALKQKGEEFTQDLAQRIAAMKQQSDEFTAQFGLNLNQFQLDKDKFAWDKAKSTFTG